MDPISASPAAPLLAASAVAPTVSHDCGGNCVFEGENYNITVTDYGVVKIQNKVTSESYKVWGDPHVNVDGIHAFDFWGRTSFIMEDGTKITIQTVPWGDSEVATVASKVTITHGDFGVHVTGVDPNTRGDLAYSEFNGQLLDIMVRDGNRIQENPYGAGFIAVDADGNIVHVDQNFINRTDEQMISDLRDYATTYFNVITGLFAMTFVGAFLVGLTLGGDLHGSDEPDRPFLLTLGRTAYNPTAT